MVREKIVLDASKTIDHLLNEHGKAQEGSIKQKSRIVSRIGTKSYSGELE